MKVEVEIPEGKYCAGVIELRVIVCQFFDRRDGLCLCKLRGVSWQSLGKGGWEKHPDCPGLKAEQIAPPMKRAGLITQ